MYTYSSAGHDLAHLMRVQRYHNSREGREFRAKRGDSERICLCDFCCHAEKVLRECSE